MERIIKKINAMSFIELSCALSDYIATKIAHESNRLNMSIFDVMTDSERLACIYWISDKGRL